ncbi:MAG: hypothetical protein GX174_02270 [Lentisphaerae bacterium]|nr:hypothetical protein [Lentisphaerota bacterium]
MADEIRRERDAKAAGIHLQPPTEPVGRNIPCPCGTGRKFKHCCGAMPRK